MPHNVKIPEHQSPKEVSSLHLHEWNQTVLADSMEPTISFRESYEELTENLQLFTLNESNKLDAINARKFKPETLAAMAAAGRLFVRQEEETELRQFGFDGESAHIRVILSEPFSDFSALPEEAIPDKPEAPAFWKYLLYPFFRSEIQEYNQEMKVYEMYTALTSPDVLDSFDVACGREPRSQVKPKENNQNERANNPEAKISDVKINAKEETLEAFALRLAGYSKESATVRNVFSKSDKAPTEETILNEMLNVVRHIAATNILREANDNNGASRNEVMQRAKENFDTMMHHMKAYLPALIDPNDKNALVGKSLAQVTDPKAIDRLNEVAKGALGKYHEQLKKDNAERLQNKQKLQQDAPQLQEPAKKESRIAGLS